MSIFVKAIAAKKPRTKEAQIVAYFYAFLLIVIVLCQLFTFEEFISLINTFNLPGGLVFSNLVGSTIVISEVFAVPFLLGMKLSPLMRIVSMASGWLAAISWIKLSVWLYVTSSSVANVGIFGDLLKIQPGFLAIFISLVLGFLAAWSSWGLWPFSRKK